MTDSAAGSPHTLALGGMGVDFAMTANGPLTQTTAAGGSATYALLLTGAAGLPGTVAMNCAGAPAYATCTVTPSGPPVAGSTLVTVTIATTSADLQMPLRPGERGNTAYFALMLPIGFLFMRRVRLGGMLAILLICEVAGLGGCAASRTMRE